MAKPTDSGDPKAYEPGQETSPLDADSDDDGLKDGDELNGVGKLKGKKTNPLAKDTDGDGVRDGVEVGVAEPMAGGLS